MIARPGAVRADDAVVVDANGDGLRIPKSARRRMATGATVVVVQPGNRVEPEQPTQIGKNRIDRPAQTLFESASDLSRKTELL